MLTLPESAQIATAIGVWWTACASCGVLFAVAPGQAYCRECDPDDRQSRPVRCEAAHPEDPAGCDGPADAVRVVDQVDDQLYGCVRHAAVVLASVEGARALPHSVDGAAIEAYQRAQLRKPFQFDPGPARPAAGGGL